MASIINRYDDILPATIAAIIYIYNDYINPRRYAEELPDELWIQIFVRLSVKSLLRVMCVCKPWYALIKDESFTRKHLQFQKMVSKNMGHFLFLQSHQIPEVTNYFLFDGEFVTNSARKSSSSSLPLRNLCQIPLGETTRPLNIDGPVNGLYCLHNAEGRIVILNPATNEVGFLPKPLKCLPDRYGNKSRLYMGVIGFGTDPLDEGNYKVVLITPCMYEDPSDDDGYGKTFVMLYTTRTNSWRHLKAAVYGVVESLNNTYLNGLYYWMAEGNCEVLGFDMSKESFRYIATPCLGNIALHSDRIYLFNLKYNLNEIDIWVMTEDNNNWLKKFNVKGLEEPVVLTFGFCKTENDLLLEIGDFNSYHGTQTVLYNTTTEGIMNIGSRGCVGGFKALVYYESLVFLSGEITKLKENNTASLLDSVLSIFIADFMEDNEDTTADD